jgi:hypothetical protein
MSHGNVCDVNSTTCNYLVRSDRTQRARVTSSRAVLASVTRTGGLSCELRAGRMIFVSNDKSRNADTADLEERAGLVRGSVWGSTGSILSNQDHVVIASRNRLSKKETRVK